MGILGPGIGDEMAIDKNLLLPSLPFVKLSEDEVETLPVMRILLTYRVFFLTGPPDFQYQNEKQVAANQD